MITINNISYYPEQARELHEAQALTSPSNEDTDGKGLDWNLAHEELMAKQGIDLKAEMAKKLKVSIVFGRHFLPVIFPILHKKKLRGPIFVLNCSTYSIVHTSENIWSSMFLFMENLKNLSI